MTKKEQEESQQGLGQPAGQPKEAQPDQGPNEKGADTQGWVPANDKKDS